MQKLKKSKGPHARELGKITTSSGMPRESRYTHKIVNQKGAFGK